MTCPSLPIAAVVRHLDTGARIFCCHGGLSPALVKQGPEAATLVRTLKRKRYGHNRLSSSIDPDAPVAPISPTSQCCIDGLLWSDPVDGPADSHFLENSRGAGFTWTEEASAEFCTRHGFHFMCRAHQVVGPGYQWVHNGKVLTVFSASNYCGSAGNMGAVLVLDRDTWTYELPTRFRTYYCAPLSAGPPTVAHPPPLLRYFDPPMAAGSPPAAAYRSKGAMKKARAAAWKPMPRWQRRRRTQGAVMVQTAAAAVAALAATQRAAHAVARVADSMPLLQQAAEDAAEAEEGPPPLLGCHRDRAFYQPNMAAPGCDDWTGGGPSAPSATPDWTLAARSGASGCEAAVKERDERSLLTLVAALHVPEDAGATSSGAEQLVMQGSTQLATRSYEDAIAGDACCAPNAAGAAARSYSVAAQAAAWDSTFSRASTDTFGLAEGHTDPSHRAVDCGEGEMSAED
eukprot:TRINITY_DN19469_c0_g1_i1.p1 TRINITY_DN19469_c0_g1~~TRINITY_DN19469_c0_g1_i1.p1  ORF type:complete len:458 (+),score=92.11 TRINITY_DN19469_c0_g1_i1:1266-2639(+)